MTGEPSLTGFGLADRLTVGVVSVIVTSTDVVLPPACPFGRLLVFSATVNVSSAASLSFVVEIVPVPVVWPAAIGIPVSVPWSPDSAVPDVTVTGIVTAGPAADRVAVTMTLVPSLTGFGEADRFTVRVLSLIVTVLVDLLPKV